MIPGQLKSFNDGKMELMFHMSPLVEAVASLHSMQSHENSVNRSSQLLKEKIESLDKKLKYNLDMYGKSYADWLLIMDVATYISCILYNETGKTEITFREAMDAYAQMDDVTFAYIFLGLSAWGFTLDDAAELINNPEKINPRMLRLMKLYLSKRNIDIFVRNIHSLKEDLAGVLEEYWQQAFQEIWYDLEHSIEKAIRTGWFECSQVGNCVQYISNFHNDIYITKEQLYLKKDVSYMLPLNEIKQIHVFPSTFSEKELLIDTFADSLVIYYNLNLSIEVDKMEVPTSLTAVFKALSDENRIKIIKLLWGAPATTQYLSSALGLAQSTVSAHLKVLKTAGLLRNKTIKKYVYYEINQTVLDNIGKDLFDYIRQP